MINRKFFLVNPYGERASVLWDENKVGVILDPGFITAEERDSFFEFIDSEEIKPQAILLTHAHFDHIYGVRPCIDRYAVPVYMSPEDKVVKTGSAMFSHESGMPAPDIDWDTVDIHEGDVLTFGDMSFEVIETPGHSPGSVCFLSRADKLLLSGDTLFAGTIGKTAHRWGDYDAEISSIMNKLAVLDPDTAVHPGHGCGTKIGYELTHNPFLEPFNEKEETFDPDIEPIVIKGN